MMCDRKSERKRASEHGGGRERERVLRQRETERENERKRIGERET